MNDGTTWGGVDGAYIIDITEEQHDTLCEGDEVDMLWARCSDHDNGELTTIEDSYISVAALLELNEDWKKENE